MASGMKPTICNIFFWCLGWIACNCKVNGQTQYVVEPVEARSSPSNITATKGSSVWLHWNYTYVGDGLHGLITANYREQIIGFNSTYEPTLQPLAKRSGQNGVLTLESPVPAPFNGRVQVISSNSTLVIHNLQYNDSAFQFLAFITVDIHANGYRSPMEHPFDLKPCVSITITGIPDFIYQLPRSLEVYEGSNLQLQVKMDGNPQPLADVRWRHLTESSPINVPSVQLYPFVYSSTYKLNNIGASYCGRGLEITLQNDIGSSSVTCIEITVILKLNYTIDLKASKNAASKCVEVEWNKAESGECSVKYKVEYLDASGNTLLAEAAYNIGKWKTCNPTVYTNVASVNLTVNFKANSEMTSTNIIIQPSSGSPNGLETGIIMVIILAAIIFCI